MKTSSLVPVEMQDKQPDVISRKPLNLFLIRHGETQWSLTSQHTGSTDIPLTAQGEDEARQLAPHLQHILFASVFTSPRKRAQRTCELVGLDATTEIVPDLAEWDYGIYEGKRSVDIHAARPGWNLFRDGCPDGESPAQVSERADYLISHLRTLEGNIALFSHGQFGGVLAARWIGLPVAEGEHFPLHTASVSILRNDPHHPEVPVIALWNVVACATSFPQQSLSAGNRIPMKQRAIERWENEGGEI